MGGRVGAWACAHYTKKGGVKLNDCTTFPLRLHDFPDEVIRALDSAFRVDCTTIYCPECPLQMPEPYVDGDYHTGCAALAIWHEHDKRFK